MGFRDSLLLRYNDIDKYHKYHNTDDVYQVFVRVSCFEYKICYIDIPNTNMHKVLNIFISTSHQSMDIVGGHSLLFIFKLGKTNKKLH